MATPTGFTLKASVRTIHITYAQTRQIPSRHPQRTSEAPLHRTEEAGRRNFALERLRHRCRQIDGMEESKRSCYGKRIRHHRINLEKSSYAFRLRALQGGLDNDGVSGPITITFQAMNSPIRGSKSVMQLPILQLRIDLSRHPT